MDPNSVDGLLSLEYTKIIENIKPGTMAPYVGSGKSSQVSTGVLSEFLISLLMNDERSATLTSKAEDYRRFWHKVRPTYEPVFTMRVILDELRERKEKSIYTPQQLEIILDHVGDSDCMYESDYCNVGGDFDSIGALLELHLENVEFQQEHADYFRNKLNELRDTGVSDKPPVQFLRYWRLLCYIGTDSALDVVRESLRNPDFKRHIGSLTEMHPVGSIGAYPNGVSNIGQRARIIYEEFSSQ